MSSPRSRIPIRISTLVHIAGGVFVAGTGSLYILHSRIQARVRNLPHYKETFNIISKHEKLLDTLGKPILIGKVDLSDRKSNYVDKLESRLRIPVSGPIEAGYINVFATRKDEEDTFITKHLDFESENGSYVLYRV